MRIFVTGAPGFIGSALVPELIQAGHHVLGLTRSEAIGEVLLGSNRPFVITSGTAIAANVDGKPSTEDGPTASWNPRAASEAAVKELTARGVNTSVVRLPQVHDTRKQGLVPYVHAVAREKRVSAYIGDGGNRWPAAHISAVAQLYRLAFEKAEPGAIYHAVDEEGRSEEHT